MIHVPRVEKVGGVFCRKYKCFEILGAWKLALRTQKSHSESGFVGVSGKAIPGMKMPGAIFVVNMSVLELWALERWPSELKNRILS